MYDVLIRNGTLHDGSGNTGYKANVAITGDSIVAIGQLPDQAAYNIDATGLVVAPGFVDLHTHSDFSFLIDPSADSKIMQGVTTELNGLCGYACAPIDRDEWWKLLYVRMTVGWSMH